MIWMIVGYQLPSIGDVPNAACFGKAASNFPTVGRKNYSGNLRVLEAADAAAAFDWSTASCRPGKGCLRARGWTARERRGSIRRSLTQHAAGVAAVAVRARSDKPAVKARCRTGRQLEDAGKSLQSTASAR
jgi:hypothetical protein